ncbi:hypothetical protein HA72_2075 [Metallosphaera sedula]|uniref:Thermopsin n=3 Tax=Metallosphaera TaxID=41980 RepID=A4YIG3_METS5|nr:hypothetical protein Msed_2075 [Metallosphaera sedula DSM 5348]AIM28198.1 hypothetical protein HA72_2075 [Metallosphaera sedula]AKV75411.1 hypothetical protein MsedA_2126 [Metallosphaera sedula]AKV77655.1 hypothetical protein MsedB_2128 [Metallosphaera sedula]AKV79902.1 hypothetical protein MsedC_2126 [Metallosphaera sedula]
MALLVALAFTLTLTPLVNALQFYPNGNQPIPYQVPTKLTYSLKVYNSTKVGNSTTVSLVESAVINYQVTSLNGTWVKVNVNSNYTPVKNVTFIQPGSYVVNYALDPLNLSYPYIYPGFLSNSTSYAIESNVSTVILSFVTSTSNNVTGQTVYRYSELSPVTSSLLVLPSGLVQTINRTVSGLDFVMNLTGYQLSNALQPTNFTSRPGYVYVNMTYSNFSATYQPSGYVEYVYPALLPGNLLLMVQYNINELNAFPLGGYTSVNGQLVNFIIQVGTPTTLVTNFISNANGTLTWNSLKLSYVGNVTKTVQGTTFNLEEYTSKVTRGNITFATATIYALKNMVVEVNYNQTFPSFSSYKLEFINGSYINPSLHFPYLTGYQNTTLPYKPVNPSESFTIAVVVTLIVIAILVILHRR